MDETHRRHRLIARRKRCGLSQEALAGRLFTDARTVRRWEAGQSEPSIGMRPLLAQALEVTPDGLDDLLRQGPEPPQVSSVACLSCGTPVMLTSLPAVGMLSLWQSRPVVTNMDTTPTLSAELRASIATGQGLTEHLGGTLSRIAVDYVHAPFMPLFTELVQVRDAVFDSLHEHQSQSRDRFFLAGTTSLLLALTLQDLGENGLAMAELRTARMCADNAGHPGLLAWSLITGARIITDEADPGQVALRMSQQAVAVAPPGVHRVRAAVARAYVAARAGDRASVRSALVQVAEARAETPVHDELVQLGGVLTYPTARQDVGLGTTYTLIGNYEAAYTHSSAAIAAYQNGPAEQRSYANEAWAHVDLMTVGLLEGAFDDDVDKSLQHITDLPAQMRIAPLGYAMDRVAALARSVEHKDDRAVRQLAGTIRDYRALGSTTGPAREVDGTAHEPA